MAPCGFHNNWDENDVKLKQILTQTILVNWTRVKVD